MERQRGQQANFVSIDGADQVAAPHAGWTRAW